jgi:DNA-binding NarL/FixJ family response regulator
MLELTAARLAWRRQRCRRCGRAQCPPTAGSSTEGALAACRELGPDVVLADLGLPAVAALLLAAFPGLAVVGLCKAGDDALVAAAIRAGARGCVDLGADGPELARAVAAAGRGQAVLSVKTVEKHAGAVLRKTGARNRTELAAQANGYGELDSDAAEGGGARGRGSPQPKAGVSTDSRGRGSA